ncbi:isochorismatase family protein [Nitrosopumilus sp.]|uniref:isochorismatase family protein n=1 Tax=Nitrosopumilus sp. TaxID=2024843 RepID=UPI00293086CE|nr:isochorismatase family protein [Nitrosopumilus sp.]
MTNEKFAERLSPDNAVVALIDHQTGLLVGVRDLNPTVVKNNVKGLASMVKVLDIPTVLAGSLLDRPNGPLMPEIKEILPDKPIIERQGEINAWDNAEFKQAIESTGRKKIIMAGIVTDVCLTFPAISAVAEGYDVYAVIDASGTWDSIISQAAMHRMTQAGVKVVTWAAVLAEIMRDWRSEKGTELGCILADRLTSYGWVVNNFMAKKAGGQK